MTCLDSYLLKNINEFNDYNTRVNFNGVFKNPKEKVHIDLYRKLDMKKIEKGLENSFYTIAVVRLSKLSVNIDNLGILKRLLQMCYSTQMSSGIRMKIYLDSHTDNIFRYNTDLMSKIKNTKKGLINQFLSNRERNIIHNRKPDNIHLINYSRYKISFISD